MLRSVEVLSVAPRTLAAVRREVRIGEVATAWKPALDQVWAFLRAHPGLRDGGHNVFLYHHPARRGDPMLVDFGVEVVRPFEAAGEVRAVTTPAARVVSALHVGPPQTMREAHDAIHEHARREGLAIGAASWEIYGDWGPDATKNETRIEYLLA